MEYKRVSKKALVIWELIVLVIWAVPVAVLLFLLPPFTWYWHLCIWGWTGIAGAVVLFYLPLLYASIKYAVSREIVAYQKGVVFNQRRFMRRDRIVLVTVRKNPLTPLFHVCSLNVSALGGQFTIPLLDKKTAYALAKELEPHSEFRY